jgi:hypothetical protein
MHLSQWDIPRAWFLRWGSQDPAFTPSGRLQGLESFCHGGCGVFLLCQWCCQCQREVMITSDNASKKFWTQRRKMMALWNTEGSHSWLCILQTSCSTWVELFLWFLFCGNQTGGTLLRNVPHSLRDYAKEKWDLSICICILFHPFLLHCNTWTSHSAILVYNLQIYGHTADRCYNHN